MLNIVVPLAGRGSRFQQAGFSEPKPLIPVAGRAMIERVISNLQPASPHRFIFLAQSQNLEHFPLAERLLALSPDALVIPVPGVTEGAACTVLLARELIDNDEPLMIANCDQLVDVSIDMYLGQMPLNGLDGLIMTMSASDPKWSFVALDATHHVTQVVEKRVISNEATVGIYNFARGLDFVRAAEKMIDKNLRVNNEFYVAPVYNELISSGARIGIFNIGTVGLGMYGLGTPEDLIDFLKNEHADKFRHDH